METLRYSSFQRLFKADNIDSDPGKEDVPKDLPLSPVS